MAGIASWAGAVHVGRNALMGLIDLRLRVAGRVGAHEHRIVRRIGVTSAANPAGIAVARGPPGMCEGRAQPICCGVASGARAGYKRRPSDLARCDVVGHLAAERGRTIPVRGVAAIAVGGWWIGTGVA